MTRICPKCHYARKESDSAPDWQCPSCQVAYCKVGGEPVGASYGRYGAPLVERGTAQGGSFKWILIATVIGAGIWLGKPLWHRSAHPAAAVMAVAQAQPSVTLYSTEWCGYCAATREFFDANGIQYTDIDVEKSTAGYERHKQLGGNGVPLIEVGAEIIQGYDQEELRANLRPWLKAR